MCVPSAPSTSATASASASELLQLGLGEAALDEEDEAARLDGAALAGVGPGARIPATPNERLQASFVHLGALA